MSSLCPGGVTGMPVKDRSHSRKTGSTNVIAMRVVARTRLVGIGALSVAIWAIGPSAAAVPAGIQPGDLIVADQDAGQVVRIPEQGRPEVLLSDLGAVRGVAVLSDGAVLA